MTTDMTTDGRTDTGQVSVRTLWVPRSLPAQEPPPLDERTDVQPEPAPRPLRERTPRPWDGWPANVRCGVVGTCAVLLACWTVSFDAIVVGAQSASIPFPFSWLCPLIVDGEMAIGTLVLVSIARTVKRRTRVYLGLLILMSVGVSMAANMAGPYTRTHLLGAPWSYFAAGVPSLWIAFIVHQLVILWRHVHRPEQTAQVDTEATGRSDVSTESPTSASSYGVRSADELWWWDGGQWRPVHPPAIELDTRSEPGSPTADEMVDAPPPKPRTVSIAPGESTPVGERQAVLAAFLRGQTAVGRDLADISVSEASRETGIPRPTIVRWLDGAPLSTFRNQPGGTGQGVAA
jgi:hypothetical protein